MTQFTKYKRKDFRTLHKDYLKDENNKTHYLEAQEGITETKDYRLSGFFSGKILISYAIQYKKNRKPFTTMTHSEILNMLI